MKVCKTCLNYCENPIFGKKLISEIYQNALGQSDCRIFKSTVFLEENFEIALLFACLHKFMKIESLWVGMVK